MIPRSFYSQQQATFKMTLSSRSAKRWGRRVALFLLWASVLGALFVYGNLPQVSVSPERDTASLSQAQVQPEKIIPAPKNIKERTAIFVFLAWLWAAIFALIYILRLQIKESDRIMRLGFFSNEKK